MRLQVLLPTASLCGGNEINPRRITELSLGGGANRKGEVETGKGKFIPKSAVKVSLGENKEGIVNVCKCPYFFNICLL